MLERDIEASTCRAAKRRGWYSRKFTSPGHRSAPDRIWLRNGICVFVEFKAPGKKPTPKQAAEHARLRGFGFRVFVIDTFDLGQQVLDYLDHGGPVEGF